MVVIITTCMHAYTHGQMYNSGHMQQLSANTHACMHSKHACVHCTHIIVRILAVDIPLSSVGLVNFIICWIFSFQWKSELFIKTRGCEIVDPSAWSLLTDSNQESRQTPHLHNYYALMKTIITLWLEFSIFIVNTIIILTCIIQHFSTFCRTKTKNRENGTTIRKSLFTWIVYHHWVSEWQWLLRMSDLSCQPCSDQDDLWTDWSLGSLPTSFPLVLPCWAIPTNQGLSSHQQNAALPIHNIIAQCTMHACTQIHEIIPLIITAQ